GKRLVQCAIEPAGGFRGTGGVTDGDRARAERRGALRELSRGGRGGVRGALPALAGAPRPAPGADARRPGRGGRPRHGDLSPAPSPPGALARWYAAAPLALHHRTQPGAQPAPRAAAVGLAAAGVGALQDDPAARGGGPGAVAGGGRLRGPAGGTARGLLAPAAGRPAGGRDRARHEGPGGDGEVALVPRPAPPARAAGRPGSGRVREACVRSA